MSWGDLMGDLNDTARTVFADDAPVTWQRAGHPDSEIAAIYDSRYFEIETDGAPIVSLETKIAVLETDVPGIAQGHGIIVRGRAYRVQTVRPDGQGMVTVTLGKK